MLFTRRGLLLAGIAAPFGASARHYEQGKPVRPILKPKALRLGDTLALVTPASGVSEQKELDDARKNLEVLGFQVKIGAHAADSWGDFGGTDQHRADDLNAAFADPEVNGIIAYTGGYGCGRIVDLLNYDSFRENPKVVIGYSDITGLDLALYARSGVVTFYGPVASSGFKGFEEENFQKVLKEPEPAGLLTPPSVPLGNPPNPAAATLHPGTVTGRLVGGNLSLIASLIGSPYLPDLSGHILFVEDIGEEPYRVDRMLNSLRISKSIKGVRGIVLATSALAESNPKSRQTQAEALP